MYTMGNKTNNDKKIEKKLESIRCLGNCQCGGSLIISVLAPKTERFTVSCIDCGSVSDVRFPKTGDVYVVKGSDDSPLKLLCRVYEDECITITDSDIENTPVSKSVNDLHGSL